MLASALIAIVAELYLTRSGPGASGDSVHYMQGANNLLAGNGFSRIKANGQFIPITGFPPGFSIALAGIGLLGTPAFEAGRYLNAILFGINTLLVGVLIYRSTRRGLLAIVGSWLFMYARNIVSIHSWVMSEPLFIFLSLLSILLFDLYLHRGKLILLILTGLVIAYAALTRYVGLALIPAVCLPLLKLSSKKWIKRWQEVLIVCTFSLGPVALWFWRNTQVSGNLVNRQLIYHPISKSLLFTLVDELFYWWFAPSLSLPWRLRWFLLFLFIAAGIVIYLYALTKRRQNMDGNKVSVIPGTTAIFGFSYFAVLILNTSFIDASTDVQSMKRYAIPLVVAGIVWVFTTFSLIGNREWSKKIAHIAIVVVGMGMVLFYASKSVPFILNPGFAFGYTDDRANWICEVNLLKAVGPQKAVITNDYEEFYFLAGYPAYTLTGKYDPYLNKYEEDYSTSIGNVESMINNGAILAMLGDPNQYPGEANALIGDMGLTIAEGCSHLRFYTIPTTP